MAVQSLRKWVVITREEGKKKKTVVRAESGEAAARAFAGKLLIEIRSHDFYDGITDAFSVMLSSVPGFRGRQRNNHVRRFPEKSDPSRFNAPGVALNKASSVSSGRKETPMRYLASGIDRSSGEPAERLIEARDQDEAASIAMRSLVLRRVELDTVHRELVPPGLHTSRETRHCVSEPKPIKGETVSCPKCKAVVAKSGFCSHCGVVLAVPVSHSHDCPHCGSSNTQKLSIIHSAGTHSIEGQANSVGWDSWDSFIAATSIEGVQQSELARAVAPPPEDFSMLVLAPIAALILVGGGVALGHVFASNDDTYVIPCFAFFGLVASIPILVWCKRQDKVRSARRKTLMEQWNRSFLCLRCGTRYQVEV